ncbi:hypothetical protein SAMN02982922_1874 [Mesorhizobium australicum]|uniref:Uncharacterized protein n=1 Tax=Mesorhizobium australicum TaxID=536018 RepID=A0A1X7NHC3_9HYPH|nr:hypothetical protein SAMN02982922_1874 [Mesorhizobium australicum]
MGRTSATATRRSLAPWVDLCRYNPPVTQPEPNARGFWPVVSSNDWCGHFSETRAA